jgi:vacuolar protein sorting-associated protein 13A/C
LGQFWLKSLENGKFFDVSLTRRGHGQPDPQQEHYVAHLEVRPENEAEHDLVVILTATRILLIRSLKLKVQWDVPLADLQSISIETKGISLTLRKGVPGPFLALPVQSGKLWLFSHMERCVAITISEESLTLIAASCRRTIKSTSSTIPCIISLL